MKKYSFTSYKKEDTKQTLRVINYNTWEEAKQELELELTSQNLILNDAEQHIEDGDILILIFNRGSSILKICPL